MYQVFIWSDLQGDFVPARGDDGKIVNYAAESDAMEAAAVYKYVKNVQAKVQYIRRQFTAAERKARLGGKSGRVKRTRTTMLDGMRVTIIATINAKGDRITVKRKAGK